MSEETKKCPFCGEEILAAAIKCRHCQSMLNNKTSSRAVGMSAAASSGWTQSVPPASDAAKINWFAALGGVLLALVATFYLGWVYIWSCSIPFVFFLMPLFYGGIAGALMLLLAIRSFRTDKLDAFIGFGLLVALVAYYANWVWFVRDVSGDFILSPGELWERATAIHSVRNIAVDTFVGSRRALLTVEGGWLTLAWLIELAMIFGGVAVGFFSGYSLSFFCPSCRRWSDEKIRYYKLASDKEEYELTSLEAIMRMTTPEEHCDHYKVAVFECPYCRNGAFSLKKCRAVVKDGKYDTEEKVLLRRIFCPADKLKELKEFLNTTGVETKE